MDRIAEHLTLAASRMRLEKSLDTLKKLPPSRETSLTITKVEEAIMWAEKIKMQEES